MDTCVVAIGRNIDAKPMPLSKWMAYMSAICMAIESHGGEIHSRTQGIGEWNDTQEETLVVIFSVVRIESLAEELAYYVGVYEQECLALITGESRMIEPLYASVSVAHK